MTMINVPWSGPFSWPGFETENQQPPIPKVPGVYLWTFEWQGGYLVYAAGLTRQTVPKRLGRWKGDYMRGKCNVLDTEKAQNAIRVEIWHGWGYARAHPEECQNRIREIREAARKQLGAFRIFVIEIGKEPRILERLEAAIMGYIYQSAQPLCDIPDEGMFLAPRWKTESPIQVKNNCIVCLHGLPNILEI